MQYVETHIHLHCSDIYPNDIATPYSQHYFPQQHVTCLETKGLNDKLLPRNQRHHGKHLTILEDLTKALIPRTQCLLTDIDELQREIRNSLSRDSRPISDSLRRLSMFHFRSSYPERMICMRCALTNIRPVARNVCIYPGTI